MDIEQQAIDKLVNSINQKRDKELNAALAEESQVKRWIEDQRRNNPSKRAGEANWIKIAHVPFVVDQWFTKMYGKDYYKDKDFFTKYYREWMVADPKKL